MSAEIEFINAFDFNVYLDDIHTPVLIGHFQTIISIKMSQWGNKYFWLLNLTFWYHSIRSHNFYNVDIIFLPRTSDKPRNHPKSGTYPYASGVYRAIAWLSTKCYLSLVRLVDLGEYD